MSRLTWYMHNNNNWIIPDDAEAMKNHPMVRNELSEYILQKFHFCRWSLSHQIGTVFFAAWSSRLKFWNCIWIHNWVISRKIAFFYYVCYFDTKVGTLLRLVSYVDTENTYVMKLQFLSNASTYHLDAFNFNKFTMLLCLSMSLNFVV